MTEVRLTPELAARLAQEESRMLLDADSRTVSGSLSDLLTLLYSSVYVDLVESGMDSDTADELTRKLLPRVEQRLVTHGFVSRQIGGD